MEACSDGGTGKRKGMRHLGHLQASQLIISFPGPQVSSAESLLVNRHWISRNYSPDKNGFPDIGM
jgi:hypothetical protein